MNPIEFVLRKLDVFSVPFTPYLNLKNKEIESSSIIGGLITLIIYTFSFIYGLILLKQWYFYEMPFKIASQVKNSETDFYLNYFSNNQLYDSVIIEVTYNVNNGVDFFKNDEATFIPLLYDWDSDSTSSILHLYDLESQSITFELKAGNVRVQKIFYLVSCVENEQYLNSQQKCASKETIEERVSFAGIEIDFTLQTSSLDIKTKNITTNNPYTLSFIQKDYSSAKFITFEYSHYNFLEGFFQEDQSEYCQIEIKIAIQQLCMIKTDFVVRDEMSTLDYLTQYSQYYTPDIQKVYTVCYFSGSTSINDILVSYQPLVNSQLKLDLQLKCYYSQEQQFVIQTESK